jgi:hypothetical protein
MGLRLNQILTAGFFLSGCLLLSSNLGAQTPSALPLIQPTPASSDNDSADESDKPFVPHWSGQLEFSRSSQPATQGAGQTQTDLGFTATDNFDESGTSLSLGASGGSQKVEGSQSGYGSLSVGGALGIGVFTPSLTLETQYGQNQLKTYSSTLDLDFQVGDPLTLGLVLGGSFQGHQGPAAEELGIVNSKSWTAGLDGTFQAFKDLSFNATLEQETEITYQYQAFNKTAYVVVDDEDRIPSLTLGFDWNFVQDFSLEGSGQFGREYYPAGTFYSPILAETITESKATSQNFVGYSLDLVWDFNL